MRSAQEASEIVSKEGMDSGEPLRVLIGCSLADFRMRTNRSQWTPSKVDKGVVAYMLRRR